MRRTGSFPHTSWLIAAGAWGILAGLVAGKFMPPLPAYTLLAAGSFGIIAWRRRGCAAITLMVVAGLALGVWRGSMIEASTRPYRIWYGHRVTVQGVVADDAAYSPQGDQRLVLSHVLLNGRAAAGSMWTSTAAHVTIARSDTVRMSGVLQPGLGGSAATMYRATLMSVERPQPGDIGLHIRDWFATGIRAAIPDPGASLASGYLVGQRNTLPVELDAQLKTVGLTHVVVASGYNVTILMAVALRLLKRVSKYTATMAASGLVLSFIAISGASPSMTRAGLVAGLTLAAWYYGRVIHPLVLLPLAAATTAVANPFYIWGDLSWYLSFASFAGVLVLAPLIMHAVWRPPEQPGVLMEILCTTLAAQAATAPIMLAAFGQYSPYALLANVLVLPLIPLTMLLTAIAGIFGLALPALATIVGQPAALVLRYTTWVVAKLAALPGAAGSATISSLTVGIVYACLLLATYLLWRRTGYRFRSQSGATLPE